MRRRLSQNGGTILHAACRLGLTDIARLLLEAGADPHTRNAHGKTPELVALDLGHSDCAGLFYNMEIRRFSPQGNSQEAAAAAAASASANDESSDTSGERKPPHGGFPRRDNPETGDMSAAKEGERGEEPWEGEGLDGREPHRENYPQWQESNGDETGAELSIDDDAGTSRDLLGGQTEAERDHKTSWLGSIAVSRARSKWLTLIDRESGSTYYQDERSGLTQWEAPEDDTGETEIGTEPIDGKESSTVIRAGKKWLSLIDRTSGSTYYQNERSGLTQWEVPEDEGGETETADNDDEERERNSSNYEEPLPGDGEEGDWSASKAHYLAFGNGGGDALQAIAEYHPDAETSPPTAGWMPSKKEEEEEEESIDGPQQQERGAFEGEDGSRLDDGGRSQQETYSYYQRQGEEDDDDETAAGLQAADGDIETSREPLLGEEEDGAGRKHIAWAADTSRTVLRARSKWLSLIDRDSGSTYYQNEQSGLTQWEAPQDDGGETGTGSNTLEKYHEDGQEEGSGLNYEGPQPSAGGEGDWFSSNVFSSALDKSGGDALRVTDGESAGGPYYHQDEQPGLTQWEAPEDGGGESRTGTEPPFAREGSSSTISRERINTWVSMIDNESGNVYYQNVQSGLVQWEVPEDGAVDDSPEAAYGDNLLIP